MKIALRACVALALAAAAPAVFATTYTSDGSLADFTSQVGSYATLSNFSAGDVSGPYTPTTSDVNAGLRVYSGGTLPGDATGIYGSNWILADFTTAQSSILVFPNMDHLGAQYDGFQYQIMGLDANKTWVPLFNALTVAGSGEPFTLDSYSGTAPTWVNNVVTPGSGPGGQVGYIARFDFSGSYSEFAFGASQVAIDQGNTDQELTAVASVPEPATLGLLGLGLVGLATRRRSKR